MLADSIVRRERKAKIIKMVRTRTVRTRTVRHGQFVPRTADIVPLTFGNRSLGPLVFNTS